MATNPTTYRGNNAAIWLSGAAHTAYSLSDFTLTMDKGVVEQELLGEDGNYFLAGALSIEGSSTGCYVTSGGLGLMLGSMMHSDPVVISGNIGLNSLHFHFKSCQITSFDFTLGDADTITEGSFDFTLLYPYKVSSVTYQGAGGTFIKDYA